VTRIYDENRHQVIEPEKKESELTTGLVTTPPRDRGAVDSIERYDAPSPGSYWLLRKDCKGRHDDRMSANTMKKGTLLMLAKVELADGEPHVYTFAKNPGLARNDACETRVHADDFYTWFEPAPDGEAMRAKELLDVLNQMETTKNLMMQPPPDAALSGILSHDPAPAIGVPGQALATTGGVLAMTRRAASLKEDAEKTSAWIQTHSATLLLQAGLLANFHQERAQAALARVHSQLEGVAGLLRTVDNLRIYTGDDIEVIQLRDGAPAAPDEKLTIYQDVLSLDEETLSLLDAGGLDHTRTGALMDALADPVLLKRLIPAQRGIVLVRFRSTYKEFVKVSLDETSHQQHSAHRYNAELSEESQRKRLLVRDGDRLWLIDANHVLAGIKQLMPSAGEQASYFEQRSAGSREPPKRITRDDLAYAKAQRAQLGALDAYGKTLILLWGLHDRIDLFEAAQIPKFSSWLDPGFQNEYLHLVSLDTLLGLQRPSFSAWQNEQNAYLTAGAWCAVDLRRCFNHERAPGAFSNGRYDGRQTLYEAIYKPDLPEGRGAVHVDRVQSDKEGLFIEVPCRYAGYRENVSRATAKIRLYVLRRACGTVRPVIAEGVLTLDRARSADLSYYLESRVQRRSYAEYITIFRRARVWTAERDAAEQPIRDELRAAVAAAQIPHDPDQLDAHLTDALAVARTARRDRSVPERGSAGFKAYLKAALAALHAALSDQGTRIASIEAWTAANGRTPLRLALTGRDAWKLYLVPSDADHDARLGESRHATWGEVSFAAAGAASVEIRGRALLRPMSDEQVIHDWNWEVPAERGSFPFTSDESPRTRPDGAAHWLKKHPLFTAPYADALATLDQALTQSAAYDAGLPLSEIVAQARQHMRTANRRFVERMPLGICIGSAIKQDTPVLLIATVDALAFAFHAGDDAIKDACREAVASIYERKQHQLAKLESDAPCWSLNAASIDAAAPHRKDVFITRYIGRHVSAGECVGSAKNAALRYSDTKVLTLTPAGARLIPWLVNLVARQPHRDCHQRALDLASAPNGPKRS